MAPAAVVTPTLLTDPGYLFGAVLATATPTNTVAGSVFTDAWAAAWVPLGATVDGSVFSQQSTIEAVRVAEFFDPIKYVTTDRSSSIAFAMANFTLHNLKRAWNGGMGAITATSGTGATTLATVTAPSPGSELRIMIGWESLDNTLRIVLRQCIQGGQVQVNMAKAPAFGAIPVTFNCEVPASGNPFDFYSAGVARLGS